MAYSEVRLRPARVPPLHVLVCCLTLLLFAFAKLGSVVAQRMRLLQASGGFPPGDELVMAGTGVGEVIAVALMIWWLPAKRSCQLLAAIGISFLLYRFVAGGAPCPCLGATPTLVSWIRANEPGILVTASCFLLLMGLWGWARETNIADLSECQ